MSSKDTIWWWNLSVFFSPFISKLNDKKAPLSAAAAAAAGHRFDVIPILCACLCNLMAKVAKRDSDGCDNGVWRSNWNPTRASACFARKVGLFQTLVVAY